MKKSPQLLLLSCAVAALAFAVSAVAQAQLPNGNGKQVVETVCAACHDLSPITSSGRTKDEWNSVVQDMIAMGATLTPQQITLVTDYLATSFPPKPRAAAPAISGTVQASFKEIPLPTQAFPHDPFAADDGSIWYTGQFGNLLGRVDPKTGQVKNYPLKTPSSGPHGLIGDKSGNIWFTANFAGYIGKLDPKSGAITEYKTPGARDPHSLSFDQDGILWFTAQGANMIGRLDPKTGDIKMIDVPTRRAAPYGMVVGSSRVDLQACKLEYSIVSPK